MEQHVNLSNEPLDEKIALVGDALQAEDFRVIYLLALYGVFDGKELTPISKRFNELSEIAPYVRANYEPSKHIIFPYRARTIDDGFLFQFAWVRAIRSTE